MLARLSNYAASFKTKNVVSNSTKSSTSTSETDVKSWEFMKKIDGLNTDYLLKQLNIASTAITPNFTLPSKAAFNNVFFAYNMLSGITKKVTQLVNVFDKNNDTVKQKEFLKISIGLSSRGYK
ncbi:MAG: hypothetical protein ACRC0G_06580 [Fusobacteriaceae bacterium]